MIRSRRFLCLAALVVCAASAGCAAEPQKPPTPPPVQASVALSAATEALPVEVTEGFDGGKAFAHVEKLVAIGPRTPNSDGIRRAQDYIRSQLQSFGCAVEEDNFNASTPIGSVPMKNILAKVPGARPGVLLFLTHYDTLRLQNFIGANDSGSSTGLMLELARNLCSRKNALTIWIAFLDGEEAFVEWSDTDSTYGSRQLAAKLAISGELSRVKAVILADMIGDRDLKIKRESASTSWLTDLVWSTAARLGYAKHFLNDNLPIEDDHRPFLKREIPALDLIDFDYPPWHTAGDTLDKVSPRSLSIVGHVLLESLKELEKKFK